MPRIPVRPRHGNSSPLDELTDAALYFASSPLAHDKSDRLAKACRGYAAWVESNTHRVRRELAVRRWLDSVVALVTTGEVIAWQLAKLVKDGKFHVATLFADGSSTIALGDTLPEAVELYERLRTEPQREGKGDG